MVVERNGCKVGVSKLVISNVGAVNLKLKLISVTEHGHTAAITSRQVFDWVIEVKLLHLGTGSDSLLDLCDEHIEGLGGEDLTLLGVEIGIVGVDLPLVGGGTRSPSDAKLDIVVLESDEGEGSLPVFTESKAERVEALIRGTTVEITSN
jgi:hypothetical protein